MPQTIVITGANSGIGAAAARQLAARGERVVIVGRNREQTAAIAGELGAPYHLADFTSLDQVRGLADDLLAAYPRIDVLANNAGGIFAEETTADGVDKTFQVNHLAPFLLTHRLLDRLVTSQAKVIQTSSIGAKIFGKIDIDDLNNRRKWKPNKAYGDAKLENILFTRELHRRYHAQGLSAVAFHPGNVATNFASSTSSLMRLIYHTPLARLILITPEEGGAHLTWLAEGTPGKTWQSGEYYEDDKLAPPKKLNPQVHDAELAKALWERSEQMLGV